MATIIIFFSFIYCTQAATSKVVPKINLRISSSKFIESPAKAVKHRRTKFNAKEVTFLDSVYAINVQQTYFIRQKSSKVRKLANQKKMCYIKALSQPTNALFRIRR